MNRSFWKWKWLLGILLVLNSPAVLSERLYDLTVRDLGVLSEQSKVKKLPILLLMSSSNCPYCDRMKAEIVHPMLKSGQYEDRVLIKEFMIDEYLSVVGFSGEKKDPSMLAKQYDVAITPTLLFLDSNGFEIEKRIVGLGNVDYAGFYIDRNIARALEKIRSTVIPIAQKN